MSDNDEPVINLQEYIKKKKAKRQTRNQKKRGNPGFCRLREDGFGNFETQCGELMSLDDDDDPFESGYHYCPFCGRILQ